MKRYIKSETSFSDSPSEVKSLERVLEYAKSGIPEYQYKVLNNIMVTPEIIDYIVDNSDLDFVVNSKFPEQTICREIASHTKSSGYALDQIAHTNDNLVRVNIASHPNALPETLDYLADADDTYSNRYTKFEVMDNPNTSVDTLKKLSESSDEDISDYALQELARRGIEG